MCEERGSWLYLLSSFTANMMSGRVVVASHRSFPTKDLYWRALVSSSSLPRSSLLAAVGADTVRHSVMLVSMSSCLINLRWCSEMSLSYWPFVYFCLF